MGKDAFIATNFVLVPKTSLSQGPMSQGPRSQGPKSQFPGLRVPGLGSQGSGSQVSGPGSWVSGPDFRLCPNLRCLVSSVFLFLFFCFLELDLQKDIFQRVLYTVYQTVYIDYYIWAIAGHELGVLNIRVHNSLAVHNNFDNFSEYQNVISDSPRHRYCKNQ